MTIFRTLTKLSATLVAGAAIAAASAALSQEVVRIGFTGPLSGGAALYGKNCLTGLQMAAEEINGNGGIEVAGKKYKVEIVSLDDRYSPSEAAVNARRLVQQSKTPIVITPHSGGAYALQAFNVQDGFLLGAYTSVPAMTERGNELTVRIPPSFAAYIEPFSKYEMKKFGKKVGIAGADHDYAKAWRELFIPAWEKLGGAVVANNPMSYNKDTDFSSGVSKVLAAKPDVMFIGGASEPTALVAKQAREIGFEGGFIVMDQAKLDEMAKAIGGYELLNGSVGILPLAADERPAVKEFIKRFHAKQSGEPGTEQSYHYTALYIFAEAMKRAGSVTDPKAIRSKMDEAIKSVPDNLKAADITGIDEKGGMMSRIIIATVENGKITPLSIDELSH
jgi:branched-chain amino acid transport system substrate-binding protein